MKKFTKSKINVFSAIIDNIINVSTSFLTRRFFVQALGLEILGVNGLFNNIISMLSIVELGFSYAVIYTMYRPIVRNDRETIKSLLSYYQKIYQVVGAIVLALGLIIMPFLPLIVNNFNSDTNIYVAFGLILADAVFSYFLSYRRSLLYATKNNYIINYNHALTMILMNGALIISLFFIKSFYLYLLLRLVFRIAENLILYRIAEKKFPYIKEKNVTALNKKIKKDIIKKIKALLVHKIGSFVVLGTDNIVISIFLGVAEVGLYSNYYAVTSAAQNLIQHALTALTPSIGHILVEENKNKNYSYFKRVFRYNFIISSLTSICIYILATPFIKIWLGNDYILSNITVLILSINFFQTCMRSSFSIFKEASGIFYEDRFVPVVEATINIVSSIILVRLFGLPGVFAGTILSSMALWCYSYPKFVYKKLFGGTYLQYIVEAGKYFFVFLTVISMIFLIQFKFLN